MATGSKSRCKPIDGIEDLSSLVTAAMVTGCESRCKVWVHDLLT